MRILMLLAVFLISSPVFSAFAAENSGSKVLIAYFSVTETTQKMAEAIQQGTGGTLYEIATTYDYPKDYDELKVIVQQELKDQARPDLKNVLENPDSYDVIFLGFPNWMGNMPMPVYSFLEEYDLSGKTVIPFCTHKGSGFGLSLQRLKEVLPKANIAEGLALSGETPDVWNAQLEPWLKKVNVTK